MTIPTGILTILCFVLAAAVAGLLKWRYPKRVMWGEMLLIVIPPLICLPIGRMVGVKSLTQDTEFWGSYAVTADYYERWDEEVPCTHTKYCTRTATCYDSENKPYSCTETYACGTEHLYDVDTHPPRWVIADNIGQSLRTDSSHFEELASRWGSRQFHDMHRDYHSIDGDMYRTTFTERPEDMETLTTAHRYENRVQASRSILNTLPPTEFEMAEYGIYEYPRVSGRFNLPVILGDGGRTQQEAERLFQITNSRSGSTHQVRVWVLLFPDQPRQAGVLQEAQWVNGNKNEFVICIGIDDMMRVQWGHVFSWTENERLKIDARMFVEDQATLDLVELHEWWTSEGLQNWERREFSEFEWITVDPPMWVMWLTMLITLVFCIGISLFVVHNDLIEGKPLSFRRGSMSRLFKRSNYGRSTRPRSYRTRRF